MEDELILLGENIANVEAAEEEIEELKEDTDHLEIRLSNIEADINRLYDKFCKLEEVEEVVEEVIEVGEEAAEEATVLEELIKKDTPVKRVWKGVF